MSYNNREYIPKNITTAVTTAVFSGKGTLQAITVNTTANDIITIQDGSTTIGILKANIAEDTYWYNTKIAGGLNIITASTPDITVTYTK